MPKPLTTLQVLPETEMGRFSSLALGADRVTALRDEFILLRAVVAHLVAGKAPDKLNFDDVQNVAVIVDSRAQLPRTALDAGLKDAALNVMTAPENATSSAAVDAAIWLLAFAHAYDRDKQ